MPERTTKTLALAFAASIMAASALASRGARAPDTIAPAPDCRPESGASGGWAATDLDGCWDKRRDGSRVFRTTAGGHFYYHPAPPGGSRFYAHGGVGG
jgi:hypothetical protein